ncbi:MAG: hypothetical protein HRT88_19490, partial [Lentisphaeraceae bacterium]|nr:hypothetical protein [Lentisphaeraceae bacterium]
MPTLHNEAMVNEDLWLKIHQNVYSQDYIDELSKKNQHIGILLRSVQAYRSGNLKRALNMGLRFHKIQKVIPEGYLVILMECGEKLDRLAELFDIFIDFADSLIHSAQLDKALNYMRLPFSFPRNGKHLYSLEKMASIAVKLGNIAARLKEQNSFRAPQLKQSGKLNIAVVTSVLVDDVQAWSKTSMQFARFYDKDKYNLKLYYMDPGNPLRPSCSAINFGGAVSSESGKKYTHELHSLKIPTEFCPPVPFSQGALWLARQMETDNIDAVLFQGNVNTNMMWVASAICSVPVKMQLCIGVNMYQPGMDSTIYMNNANLEKEQQHWQAEWGLQRFIGGGADILEASRTTPPNREDIDIPADAIVFGNLSMFVEERVTEEYMDCVAEILIQCPNAYFLCIGSTNTRAKEQYLNDQGVGERCRWLGLQRESFKALKYFDFYFNEIPRGSSQSIRECMSCGIPALAMKYSANHPESAGADIVGAPYALMSNSPSEYVRRAVEWIQNLQAREQAAKAQFIRAKENYSAENF